MKAAWGRRTSKHKAVCALVKGSGGGDPEEIIRAKARELVRWAKHLGWRGPPYNPLQLASLRGIKHRASPGLFSAEAQLTSVKGRQLLLEFNPDRPEGRLNYSVCHELVHTFFDDCYELIHQRKVNVGEDDPDHEVERLCQIGAAELLMPEEDFAADLKEIRFSLTSVPLLANRYTASREAVVRRMVYLAHDPCAGVFLSQRLAPREKTRLKAQNLLNDLDAGPVAQMRVLYRVTHPDFPVFIPEHKSTPNDSIVYQAQSVDQVVAQIETWNLPGFVAWPVEAMALPIPIDAGEEMPAVVALILPDR